MVLLSWSAPLVLQQNLQLEPENQGREALMRVSLMEPRSVTFHLHGSPVHLCGCSASPGQLEVWGGKRVIGGAGGEGGGVVLGSDKFSLRCCLDE